VWLVLLLGVTFVIKLGCSTVLVTVFAPVVFGPVTMAGAEDEDEV
jgi:hypothetical protein